MDSEEINAAAFDYNIYCKKNLNKKLKPVHEYIEVLLTRLEEFQILLEIVKKNQTSSSNISTILLYSNEFNDLCNKIDKVEALMNHIDYNLDCLEDSIVKAENDLGFKDTSIKVPNLFSPLFKKSDKKKIVGEKTPLDVQEYFVMPKEH